MVLHCHTAAVMQRISVAVSEETHEALRARAYEARCSVAQVARVLIETALADASRGPVRGGQGSDRAPVETHETAHPKGGAARAGGPSTGAPKLTEGERFSAVCPKRMAHVVGEVCSICKGVRP